MSYKAYKDGFLPHSGGTRDQHCKFERLMYIFDSTINLCDNRLRDVDNKKSNFSTNGTVSILGNN